MEPLSSKVLNDQIIYLRKEVRRAVVHQIHHLTTAAKRLRSKKGTDEQKEKNALKATNMYSEIKILKNLKPDEISLFALTNFEEDDLKMFVSKQIIAPETKAKAKLCLRKNLRSAVDQFIAKHSEETDLLNKLLEARYLCQEKKINKKEKKKHKQIESENLVEQNPLSSEDAPSDSMVPELLLSDSDSIIESLDLLNNSKIKEMQSVSSNEIVDHSMNKVLEARCQDKKSNKNEKKKHNKVESTNLVKQNHSSPEDTSEFRVSDSDSINEGLYLSNSNKINKKTVDKINVCSNPVTTINRRNETQSILEEIKTSSTESDTVHSKGKTEAKHVNPFFVNRDSSKYYTYRSVEVKPQKEKDEGQAFQKDFKNNSTDISRRRKNDFSNKNNQPRKVVNTKSMKHLYGKNERITNKKEWKNSRQDVPLENVSSNVKLHPSWEAKKKMSISSVPFQGKKITFDD